MRFSTTGIFAFFALVGAAAATPARRVAFPGFPDCAQACLANPNLGGCKAGDNTCMCNNSVFVQTTFDCIQAACTGFDLAAAIDGAEQLCLAVHVTLVSAEGAKFSATASLASAPSSPSPTGAATRLSGQTTAFGVAALGAIALAL